MGAIVSKVTPSINGRIASIESIQDTRGGKKIYPKCSIVETVEGNYFHNQNLN